MDLAERYALRGYDVVQLETACELNAMLVAKGRERTHGTDHFGNSLERHCYPDARGQTPLISTLETRNDEICTTMRS